MLLFRFSPLAIDALRCAIREVRAALKTTAESKDLATQAVDIKDTPVEVLDKPVFKGIAEDYAAVPAIEITCNLLDYVVFLRRLRELWFRRRMLR